MPNRLLPCGRGVNGVERQGNFDELFAGSIQRTSLHWNGYMNNSLLCRKDRCSKVVAMAGKSLGVLRERRVIKIA